MVPTQIDILNLSKLQEISIKYSDRYIVMIHHLKKSEKGDDPYTLLSGSVGVQSSSDGMIVLKSERRKGFGISVYCMPRDGEQLEFFMSMTAKCKFQFTEDVLPQEWQQIVTAIKQLTGWKKDKKYKHDGVRPKAVAEKLMLEGKKTLNTLSKRMQRMLDREELIKGKKYGLYKYPDADPIF